jgi:alpha-beta hydrolase superfamily lysophospholipase
VRRKRRIIIGAALFLVSAACTAVVAVSSPVPSIGATPAGAALLPPPPGLPGFYSIPDPLPAGKPGDVIATELENVPGLHGTLYRVMYHSKSVQGDDIPVTGLIAVPSGAPPTSGYPVISWAHGTTGIADVCAPSLDPTGYASFANALLDQGYEVTATDYEGLGTPGRHPYIVGDSEARGVLDIVRAARNIPTMHASDHYLVWGHSQGGHAAMFSLHIADQWAPELHLMGVVAGAPPSQLLLFNTALQNSPFRYYLLMAAAGFNAAYGDQQAPLDAVLTPLGIQKLALVDQGCTGTIAAGVQGINFSDLEKADPASVPAWHDLLVANDPGHFTQAAPEPLLIIQGGADEQIPVISTQILFGQMCTLGQGTQRWIYPGQSHAGVIAPSFTDMLNWIADRFAAKAAPSITPTGMPGIDISSCAATVQPTTTTTTSTTVASTTTTTAPKTTATTIAPASTTSTTAAAVVASNASGTTTTTGTPQVLGTQFSSVAFTGMDVRTWLECAAFLLLAGTLLLLNERERRRRPQR